MLPTAPSRRVDITDIVGLGKGVGVRVGAGVSVGIGVKVGVGRLTEHEIARMEIESTMSSQVHLGILDIESSYQHVGPLISKVRESAVSLDDPSSIYKPHRCMLQCTAPGLRKKPALRQKVDV